MKEIVAPEAAISMAVDASDSHVGGVLQQLENSSWRPLAFFSQKLTPTQAQYSTFDRELFAAYSAVRHFWFLLEGRKFRLITDHKSLVAAMQRTTPPWSDRQQWHLSFLSEFTSDLRHASGHTNVVADALSRPPPFLNCQPSPYHFRPTSTPATQLLSHYRQPSAPLPSRRLPAWCRRCRPPPSSPSTLPPSQLPKKDGQTSSLCRRHPPYASSPGQWGRRDISTGVRSLHDVHHPGVRATTRLVKAAFCWPKMGKDITAFA